MKGIKLFVLLYCLLSITGVISGCRKEQDIAPFEETQELVYVPSFASYDVEVRGGDFVGLDDIYIRGNCLYAVSTVYEKAVGMVDCVQILDLATGEQSIKELEETSGGNGGGRYFMSSGGCINYSGSRLVIYDRDFAKTGEIDLSALSDSLRADGKRLDCQEIAMDKEGRIGIISQDELFILDGEGRLLFSVECPRELRGFGKPVVTENGEWYISCKDYQFGFELRPVDMEQKLLGDKLENVPKVEELYIYGLYSAEESRLWIVTNDYLYRYDLKTQSCEEMFCMRNYGINMESGAGVGVLESGEPVIVRKDKETVKTEAEQSVTYVGFEVVALAGKPADEAQTRTEIVIATLSGLSAPEREIIMSFNRHNPDYYAAVKVYEQSFTNDLITGNGADIFLSREGAMDLEALSQKGALADLYEFMEADEEIGREDFIPGILKALEHNGKLYIITPGFYLRTLAGKASLLDKYVSSKSFLLEDFQWETFYWDFNAVYALWQEKPKAALLSDGSPENLLRTFVCYSMDMFYDMDTGECRFDSEEFVKMLKTAALANVEYDYSKSIPKLLHNEEILLYDTSILYGEQIQIIEKYFGEEVIYAGYPTNSGSGTVIAYNYQWAVSSRSKNKEGAWQFIKSLFSEECQKSCNGFPLIQRYFEEGIEEQMENGANAWYIDGVRFDIEPMTEEQAMTLRSLVYSAALTDYYDAAIYDIIMEEAQAFFAGDKTAEEAAELIQDRAQVYADEKR